MTPYLSTAPNQSADGFGQRGYRRIPFIEAERAERGNVAKACQLLEVSRSAFYEHVKHLPSASPLIGKSPEHAVAPAAVGVWEAPAWGRSHP